jgi:periplasmic protein TonB
LRDNSEPLLAIPKDSVEDEVASPPAPAADTDSPSPFEPSSGEPLRHFIKSDTRELQPTDETLIVPEQSRAAVAPTEAHAKSARRRRSVGRVAPTFDPLQRILFLMERERRIGMSIGLAGALIVHGAAAAHGYSALLDLGAFAAAIRSAVVDDVRATYAVEVHKPPPPPPVPTAEPPEPEKPQPQQKAPAAAQNQTQDKPPAPAQAAKVLTAEADPSEPLDLTDQGFVSGDGDRFAGGVTSATGTSRTAVRNLNAKPGGVVGGKGTGPAAPPPPPKQDLSRPASPAVLTWDDCGFPAEADVEQIDFMRVTVVVTVGTDGRAQSVTLLKDPGYGFGNQARQCALRKSYNVGFNADGKPVVTTTPPFIVTFRR